MHWKNMMKNNVAPAKYTLDDSIIGPQLHLPG